MSVWLNYRREGLEVELLIRNVFQRFRVEIIKNYRDRKEEITIRDVELELYVAGV